MNRIIAFIALLLVAVSLTATPLVQLGGIVYFDEAVTEIEGKDFLDLDNYDIGVDVRFNPLGFISIDLPVTYGGNGQNIRSFDIIPSLNLNIGIADVLDIAAGIGCRLSYVKYVNYYGSHFYFNGNDSLIDGFMDTEICYRAAVTGNISMIGLGVVADIPTDGTFRDFSMMPDFKRTRIGLAVMYNF